MVNAYTCKSTNATVYQACNQPAVGNRHATTKANSATHDNSRRMCLTYEADTSANEHVLAAIRHS